MCGATWDLALWEKASVVCISGNLPTFVEEQGGHAVSGVHDNG